MPPLQMLHERPCSFGTTGKVSRIALCTMELAGHERARGILEGGMQQAVKGMKDASTKGQFFLQRRRKCRYMELDEQPHVYLYLDDQLKKLEAIDKSIQYYFLDILYTVYTS